MLIDRLNYEVFNTFTPPLKEIYGPERNAFRYVYTKAGRRIVACDIETGMCTLSIAATKYDEDRKLTFAQDISVQAIDESQHGLSSFVAKISPQQAPLTIREYDRMSLRKLREADKAKPSPGPRGT
jgi:hypothetical protein